MTTTDRHHLRHDLLELLSHHTTTDVVAELHLLLEEDVDERAQLFGATTATRQLATAAALLWRARVMLADAQRSHAEWLNDRD